MKNKKIVLNVVVCVVIALLSFRLGMAYSNSKNLSDKVGNRNFGQPNGDGFGMPNGQRVGMKSSGGFVNGEVLSMDDKSMTIKLRDGGSKIVLFSPNTKVEKTVDGVTSDVAVGKTVMVTGTTNPDGSVSATSIQLRPIMPIGQPIPVR